MRTSASSGGRSTGLCIAGGLAAVATCVAGGRALTQDKPSGVTETCVTAGCHAAVVTWKVMHGPVAQQKCLACHEWDEPREHRFRLAGEASDLCTTCHVFPHKTVLHEPVRQGNCTGCHDPHGSNHSMMLVADPGGDLCRTCHQEFEETAFEFVHGPVADGACIVCHDAHSSWQPSLLTAPARELCLDCHSEIAPAPGEARYRHEPVDTTCISCHDPHASNTRYQLHEDAPGLCYNCHGETLASIETGQAVHGAIAQEGGCTGCHAAHYSALPALQRDEQPQLCLNCHDQPIETADGSTLTNMAALLRDNPDHHGPIREGACSACHPPHAAEHPRLLRKAYPPEFYAEFERERYALCFECHIAELVETEHGTGLTRFRDGDRNLHWLHVNRKKGRTCRTCHEIHASRNPFHVRDSVPFGTGGWELEIRYEKTPTGGSCAPGCHAKREYRRGPDAADDDLTRDVGGGAR